MKFLVFLTLLYIVTVVFIYSIVLLLELDGNSLTLETVLEITKEFFSRSYMFLIEVYVVIILLAIILK